MNYGELIGDAFRITLRNRYLWFFGFFAGGSTSFNVPNIPTGSGNFNTDDFQSSSTMLSAVQVGQGLGTGVLIAGIVDHRYSSSLCSLSSCPSSPRGRWPTASRP